MGRNAANTTSPYTVRSLTIGCGVAVRCGCCVAPGDWQACVLPSSAACMQTACMFTSGILLTTLCTWLPHMQLRSATAFASTSQATIPNATLTAASQPQTLSAAAFAAPAAAAIPKAALTAASQPPAPSPASPASSFSRLGGRSLGGPPLHCEWWAGAGRSVLFWCSGSMPAEPAHLLSHRLVQGFDGSTFDWHGTPGQWSDVIASDAQAFGVSVRVRGLREAGGRLGAAGSSVGAHVLHSCRQQPSSRAACSI